MASFLHAQLVGDFRLTDDTGRDCTPRGAKSRALVALLALTPERRRSRRWIESKLWSDRGPDQASGSLRQAIMELRLALGPASGGLVSDRENVAFVSLTTDVDSDPEAIRASIRSGRDLLEGFDVRDQAFEAWLREQRSRFGGAGTPARDSAANDPSGIPFHIVTGTTPPGYAGFVSLAMADAIAGLVPEFASVDVFGQTMASVQLGAGEHGMSLRINTSEANGGLHLLATLTSLRTGQVLWSRRAVLPLGQAELLSEGEFPGIVFEAAEAALMALPRIAGGDMAVLRAEALAAKAVREMFSFEGNRLRLADAMLRDAEHLMPNPRFYAWHSLLRQIMAVERTETDRERLFDEADMFARRAMEGAPNNPLVLSLASQVQVMLHGNVEAGVALARDAIAMSPNNAFAYAAKAGSLLRGNDPVAALGAAEHGAKLAARSGFLQWWESLAGHASLLIGDFDGAISYYEAARARAPLFRPALRHLLFLYLKCGQPEKALRVLEELKRIEPDFSFDRIRGDPSYPAGTLRRVELIKLSLPH